MATLVVPQSKIRRCNWALIWPVLLKATGPSMCGQPATDRRRSDKGILLYPIINIEFALNDLPLAAKLVELLGGGRVFKRKGNSYNLQIHDLATLSKVVTLLNGNLRSPKIEALKGTERF